MKLSLKMILTIQQAKQKFIIVAYVAKCYHLLVHWIDICWYTLGKDHFRVIYVDSPLLQMEICTAIPEHMVTETHVKVPGAVPGVVMEVASETADANERQVLITLNQ